VSEDGKKLSREEVAAIEVGHTDVSPATARFLIATFLIVIVGVPAVQIACDLTGASARLASGPGPAAEARKPYCVEVLDILPRGEELRSLDGFDSFVKLNTRMLRDINEFEDELEEGSLLQRALIPPAQWVLTGWLRAGNEKVYCGRDGWLFYRPGVDYVTARGFLEPGVLAEREKSGNEWTPPPQPDPLEAILDFRRQLAERGIELVVVPAPVKPSVHPEKFSGRFGGRTLLQNPSFAEFKRRLTAAGVRVYDPAPLLMELKEKTGRPVYLETDTHWTPEAVEAAARGLAEFITGHGLAPREGPRPKYTRRESRVSNLGDIAGMLKLPAGQEFYAEQTVTVREVLDADGKPWEPAERGGILLLGDSFSNIYSLEGMDWGRAAGFAEQLSCELGQPLDRIVINDNGAHAARGELARALGRGIDRLAGKRLVVWEFAARELCVGDWKLLEVKLDEKRWEARMLAAKLAAAGDPAAAKTGTVVEGKVLDVTRPPKPGAVPYKDALCQIHLGELRAVSGKLDAEAILVYAWVMRNNKLTAAARLKKGDRVTLKLTEWDTAQKKYGSYNRREIQSDDMEVMMLDVYWGEPLK
jgi:alginate O-acetyltransferase complex protein AlgJ